MREMDNLARDMLAAKAAGYGCNYGRFIADCGHTAEPAPRKIQEKTAICKLCGIEFIQQKKWPRQYCGAECRERARRRQQDAAKEKRRAKTKELTVCAAPPE